MLLDDYLKSIQHTSIAVIGAGISNMPLIRLLLQNRCSVTVCDRREEAALGETAIELKALGAVLRTGEDYLDRLDQDLIFRTPGLMPFDPHLEAARRNGSTVTSEMEVFFSLCPCRTVAVTGSDGKTTTTTIISKLLEAAGHKVFLGGNIGRPLLCDLPQMGKSDIAVLELSSFQLHSMKCRPDVAVITNISPNHLDKHKDYRDYIDAKSSIFSSQRETDTLVLNREDGQTAYYESLSHSSLAWFSAKGPVENGAFLDGDVLCRASGGHVSPVIDRKEILLPGDHNVLNYLAAFAATEGLADDDCCRRVASSFTGVEHRLERVRILKGVTFINDSIGSSPSRTAAGLRALPVKPVVILGGYDKHIAFDGLGDDLCRMAKYAVITGATAEKIRQAIENSAYYPHSGFSFTMVDDFDEAVRTAARLSEEGDIVLLSPACASFDRFKNFAERGDHFKKLVMELKDEDIGPVT